MNSESGKTFRTIKGGRKKDTSMVVDTKNPTKNSVEICGYEFSLRLPYSMKKKQRWHLASMISKESCDEDMPIVYTKYQCVYDDTPLLDMYLYDSLSNTTVGSIDVSNRQLSGGSFNIKGVLGDIVHRNVSPKMSIEQKMKDDIYEIDTQNSSENERQNCVYFNEYVHVNDLSKVNMVKPYRYKYYKNSNVRKKVQVDDLLEQIYDYDNDLTDEEIVYEDVVRKPFIISGEDLVCPYNENTIKNKRRRKKKPLKIQNSHFDKDKTIGRESNGSRIVYEDVLPFVIIDLSRDQFINQMQLIASFCKSWQCDVTPLTILVDLDEFEETREKSFVLLRPTVQKSEHSLSVKVFLNVSNHGFVYNEIRDCKFDSLVALVTLIQSRLKSGKGEKLSILPKVVMLDESIDELSNLPKVKHVESAHYLYLYHDEWRHSVLNSANLKTIIDLNDNLIYSMDECSVCDSIIPDDESIILKQCQHRVCASCLSHHIVERLDAHIEDINCPCSGCVSKVDGPTLLSVVSWQHYRLRLDLLESIALTRCGQPCFGCGSVLISNDSVKLDNKSIEYVCACGKIVCSGCGQLQHWPSSCQEMKDHNTKAVKLMDRTVPDFQTKSEICATCSSIIGRQHWKIFMRHICYDPTCKISKCRELKYRKPKSKRFNESTFLEDTMTSGLKLFDRSLYLGSLLRKENLEKFKRDLFGIISSELVSQTTSYSIEDFAELYAQVLRTLEAMYVSAYHNFRKTNPPMLARLKSAANHLLFYIGRIRALTVEIRALVGQRYPPGGTHAIRHKYASLERHIEDARIYARKTVTLLKFN